MGFSKLVNKMVNFGTKNSNVRTEKIIKITPHHMAGVGDPVEIAKWHYSRPYSSANYYIGSDGTIVGGVDENRRPWTSSSSWNDQRAITFEVSNSKAAEPWPISDKAYASLVKLCADICTRYNITPHYTGNKNGTITVHNFYDSTACPGPYLMNIIKSGKFEKDIIAAMGGTPTPEPKPTPTPTPGTDPIDKLVNGDIIQLRDGAKYTNGKAVPNWVIKSVLYYRGKNDAGIIFSTQKTGAITGVTNRQYVIVPSQPEPTPAPAPTPSFTPYMVKVTTDTLRIRKGPGLNYDIVGYVHKNEIYTIVDKKDNWGKLKSGAGWICLDYTVKY